MKHLIALYCFLFAGISMAQSTPTIYKEQINAFEQSFEARTSEKLKPYLSSNLVIDPIPKEQTALVLNQIFGQLPLLTALEIKESNHESVLLHYTFQNLGERESSLFFDEERKIKKIELFENLIKESRERRELQQGPNAVQPIKDELSEKFPSKKISIPTSNNYAVVGDLYDIGANNPIIILCHQAGYNKYEYADIAPKLNNMGFNCLAVDLSGGGTFAAHFNETSENRVASGQGSSRTLISNEIEATINYLAKKYTTEIIVWGSSYSASLAATTAANNDKVSAFIAFSALSPSLASVLPGIEKPFFMTASKAEGSDLKALLKDTTLGSNQILFIPSGAGAHGSKAIWNGAEDANEYWVAIRSFLNTIK